MNVRALVVAAAFVVAAPAALAWAGRPTTPPPKPPGDGAPPPAWIETATRSAWLAYGSYCWKTACVDMIPPQSRPDLPSFAVRRGTTVRVVLGFAAKSLTLSIGQRVITVKLDPAKRSASWIAASGGILTVFGRRSGDASYVTRLRVG